MTSKTLRPVLSSLVIAGVMLAAVLALALAKANGLIDKETVTRVVQALIGFVVAHSGNAIPKHVSHRSTACAGARAQTFLRLNGWAMVLAGLAYSGVWVFAPIDIANVVSISAVLAALAVMLVSLAWLVFMPKKPEA